MHDAVIVGAGPGGATAATCMAQAGLRVLLLDKAAFPRDKVCGDAISGKSVDVLRRLDLLEAVTQVPQVGSWGVTFGGPYGDTVAIPFTKMLDQPVPPGFVCARTVFDHVLFEKAAASGAEVWTEAAVEKVTYEPDGVTVTVNRAGHKTAVRGALVVGADGAYSVVARSLGMDQLNEAHYCAGVRAYYEGVTGFHARNHVELHFTSAAIPGYFWIFPMADGRANVGVGMLSKKIKKRGVRLKHLLDEMVAHPYFRERFTHARRVGPVKGWGLPLGSKPRPMAGDRWLLVGDAASLIDPFTGEGIGNAMVSGEQAAVWTARARAQQDYSAAFLKGYEKSVLQYLGGELRISHGMQRLVNWQGLLNLVIRKAARSEELADAISCMFDDEAQRRQLLSPMFYLRVLTA